MKSDQERVWFMRGALAMAAAKGQVIHYDELRRLCRLSREAMGGYLAKAREGLQEGEPDLCSVVVNDTSGHPGEGWGDAKDWALEMRRAHRFWQDRWSMDNPDFEKKQGMLPTYPPKMGK